MACRVLPELRLNATRSTQRLHRRSGSPISRTSSPVDRRRRDGGTRTSVYWQAACPALCWQNRCSRRGRHACSPRRFAYVKLTNVKAPAKRIAKVSGIVIYRSRRTVRSGIKDRFMDYRDIFEEAVDALRQEKRYRV